MFNTCAPLFSLLLIGCLPSIIDAEPTAPTAAIGGDADEGGSDQPDDEDGSDDEYDSSEDGDDSSEDDVDDDVDATVRSGEFGYTFSLEADPCGWEEIVRDAPDGLADFMPTEFAVEERAGGFDIEAVRFGGDFGTDGPVRCDIEGTAFTCEPQEVVPVDAFLGIYGWRYEVVFAGEVEGRNVIRGRSTVRFPSVDDATFEALDAVGISPLDCTQDILMTLRWER
jgi:hypothetical protein